MEGRFIWKLKMEVDHILLAVSFFEEQTNKSVSLR